MAYIDYTSQEKKEKEDLPELRLVLMQQYKNSKINEKSAEEDWLKPPETTQTTRGST